MLAAPLFLLVQAVDYSQGVDVEAIAAIAVKWFAAVCLLAIVVGSARSSANGGPVLVLQDFAESPKRGGGSLVSIRGRRVGIVSWIQTLLGIDASVTLVVNEREVELSYSSLLGESFHRVPIAHVSSTHAAYSRPLGLLLLAAYIAFVGLAIATRTQGSATLLAVLVTLSLSGLFALWFSLNRSVRLAVESSGGLILGIRYKGSLIEGRRVDLTAARRVCRLIGDLSVGAYSSSAESNEQPVTGRALFCGECGARQQRAVLGEICENCREPLA